ncbi:MAG: hemerythrin domain-containing protein [Burkholderiales bacterium]|nr:hemerythrin domain-containing protein [Burkholderiales bacterium]
MTIPFPGHSAPSAGFEVPLEMLEACHHRVQHQCETLLRLPAHLAAHGADADARRAVVAVMRYFDTAAQDHHADEETDLFPALIESMAGSDAVCLRSMIEGFCTEHRTLEAHWRRLRALLSAIAEGERTTLAEADVTPLTELYARHIAREEAELLPMAARLLDDDALERIGSAMRRRRGIDCAD